MNEHTGQQFGFKPEEEYGDHMDKLSPPDGTPFPQIKIDMTGNDVWSVCDSILLCSGGMDSTTLGYYMVKRMNKRPLILFFKYGQKTFRKEWLASMTLSNNLKCPFLMIDLGDFPKYINSSILRGHADDDNVESTVVPGRNLLFASFAISLAQSHNIRGVYIGTQVGDSAGYPDCKPRFWNYINSATSPAYNVVVEAPFAKWTKKAIAILGRDLGVDYSETYSCYRNDKVPCGECPSCKLRTEAGL